MGEVSRILLAPDGGCNGGGGRPAGYVAEALGRTPEASIFLSFPSATKSIPTKFHEKPPTSSGGPSGYGGGRFFDPALPRTETQKQRPAPFVFAAKPRC